MCCAISFLCKISCKGWLFKFCCSVSYLQVLSSHRTVQLVMYLQHSTLAHDVTFVCHAVMCL